MSVATAARSRWPGWVSAYAVLGVVDDLLELAGVVAAGRPR